MGGWVGGWVDLLSLPAAAAAETLVRKASRLFLARVRWWSAEWKRAVVSYVERWVGGWVG